MMPPEVVAACASKLVEDPEAAISTCAHALSDPEAFANPNVVKVVCDARDRALYFSRARIPFPRDADGAELCVVQRGGHERGGQLKLARRLLQRRAEPVDDLRCTGPEVHGA